jgi:hypothetical protein
MYPPRLRSGFGVDIDCPLAPQNKIEYIRITRINFFTLPHTKIKHTYTLSWLIANVNRVYYASLIILPLFIILPMTGYFNALRLYPALFGLFH